MSFRDLYEYAKKQEEAGTLGSNAKSSETIKQDAIARGLWKEPVQKPVVQTTVVPKASYQALAEKAQKEYDAYIQSDTYSRKHLAAMRKRMLEMAMTPGGVGAHTPASSFSFEDPEEQRLRAVRDYFVNEMEKEKNQAVTDANLAELESWPPEDRQALILYATNRETEFYNNLNPNANGIHAGTAESQASGIIEKYGLEKVRQLAESYQWMQSQKLTEDVTQRAGEAAGKNGWAGFAHSAATLGANVLGGISSPIDYLQELTQRTGQYSTLNPNSYGNIPNVYTDSVRGAVAENISGDVYDDQGNLVQDGGFGRQALATVYQAGMSAMDNLARIALSGGSSGVSLAFAASGTLGRSMSEYSAQGASPGEAFWMGALDACLEIATEKVSLENLLTQATTSPANFLDLMKGMAKAGFIEVSEEEASFIGSAILQSVFLGDKSSYNQQIAQAVAEGKSYEQAKQEADRAMVLEAGQTMVQSFLSGGMMSGAQQGKGAWNAAKLGKTAEKSGMGQAETDALIQKGLEADPKSNENQVAKQLQGKQDKGKNLTRYDRGRMLQAGLQSEDDSFGALIRQQIEENMGIRPKSDTAEKPPLRVTMDPKEAAAQAEAYGNPQTAGAGFDVGAAAQMDKEIGDFLRSPQYAGLSKEERTAAVEQIMAKYQQTRVEPEAKKEDPAGAEIRQQMEENLGIRPKEAQQQESQVTPEVQKSLNRLSKATGRDVQIYSKAQGQQGMENGYYENGTIYINSQGKQPHVQVFSHELTHSVELADSYKDLSKLIFHRIEEQGVDLNAFRENKKQLYAENGVTLDVAGVDSEIVADYVADHLLTDEASILSLTQENRTLSEKIKGWIDRVLARLGNEDAQERVFLQKARSLYAKALGQTQNHAGQQDEAYSNQDLEDTRSWAQEAYAAGEMTQEEFDSMMEYLEQQSELEEGASRQFSFAGQKAATADMAALQQAKNMEEQDVSPETIRQQTGWFRGMDGKWRFEIDDSDMRYHRGGDARFSEMHEDYARYQELQQKMLYWNLDSNEEAELRKLDEIWGREYGRLSENVTRGNAQLQNILRHDELFEAYPELRGAKVKFVDLEEGHRGNYNSETNTITLSSKLRNAPQKTLLHEIQHAIQEIEGFTPGASVEYWKEHRSEIIETIAAARKNLDLWLEDIGYFDFRNESIQLVVKREKTLKQHWRDVADFKANSKYARQIANCEAELAEFQRQYDEITNGMTVYDQYQNTAGEIEARDTANRRDLDAAGRKNTPPDLGDENTVFAESSGISLDHAIAEYPYDMQTVLRDYVNAVDNNVLAFIKEVQSGTAWSGKKITVGTASSQMVEDIARLTGVSNTEGCKILMNTGAVQHIENRHGIKGEHDTTMRDARDIARINYILQNYDSMEISPRKNFEYKNRDGSPSQNVVISKKINGTYFVIEAAPNTGKIGILSAYMNKNGASQVPDTNAPGRNVQNELASTPNNSISEENGGVNQKFYISPVEDDQGQQVQEGHEEEKTDVRASLPAKARGYLERKEKKFLDDLAFNLYVPRHAKREYLVPIVKELSDEFLREGAINEMRVDSLFDMAFANGIIADSEFYEENKDVKKYIRDTKLTLSEQDKSNIADFNDFRRRARGTLTIVNQGGLPVDTFYEELRTMAPHLFPESITHPADQLMHIYDVGQSIRISEKNLVEFFKDSADEYRKYSKTRFREKILEMQKEWKQVQKYSEDRQGDPREEEKVPATAEEAVAVYKDLKDARRVLERAEARNLLTEEDKQELTQLMRGRIQVEDIDPELNVEGIREVYEAKREYEKFAKQIAAYKRGIRAKAREKADRFLGTAMEWRDKKSGVLYSRETMRRNIQDIVPDGDLAKEINDTYFEPVHIAEAEKNRFLNEFRDKVRALKLEIKPRKGDLVSEAHAVQLYGEAMDNIEMIRNSRGRMKTRDGKTEKEWQAVITDMFNQSPSLDQKKIEDAVKAFRDIYDGLYQRMNDVRIRNGYEPVNYRRGYFPHFQMENGDSMLLQFGHALGIDTQFNPLPTTINGLTSTFRPSIQWFGHAQSRLGFNTAYDAVAGFDKYIEGVANVIYHTENIQNLRALESQIRYRTSEEGIRKQVDEVRADSRLTDEEKEMKISEIYKNGKYVLSNFVDELSEYTNLLAGKKSRLDRGMEALIGRRAYTIVKNLENRVGANMVAGNLNSAFTNFIPLTQAAAQLDRNMIAKGMWDTLHSYKQADGFWAGSTFLTNRRGSESLVRTRLDEISQTLGKPMELIDNFVSESIVRGAYQQYKKNGLSDAEALYQADIFAAGVIGDRSKGSMPTLFESKNPLIKAFTQFQLEVNNQFSEVFKDIPRREKEAGLKALTGTLFKYFLGAFLYNEVYEWLFGRRPAMDPIGILNDTVGGWIGYELEGETEKGDLGDAMWDMGNQVVEQLPFVGGLAGGGRIPISSAVPDLGSLWDAATEEEWSAEKRWAAVKEELSKLAYVVPPFGGGQALKSWKGIKAYMEGGSYTVDNEGNDILQYPVYRDEKPFRTFMSAALFGKNSLPAAREWVEDGFDSLTAKQTAVYQDMINAGTGDRQAYELIREVETVEKTETESKAEQQRKILMDSEISAEAKAIVYYGLIADDTNRTIMDTLDEQGEDYSEVAMTLMKIQDTEKLKGIEGSCAKRDAIANASLTDEAKIYLYREKVSDSKDEEISQIRAAGLDFDEYLKIQNCYARINDQYAKAGDKATAFSSWVNKQGYTDRQKKAIKDSFQYFTMFPATAERYDELVAAGIAEGTSYEIATQISNLKPLAGKDKVDDLQKYKVVVSSGLSEKEQLKALGSVLGEGLYKKVSIVCNNGVSPKKYLEFREILPQFDANGSGSFSKAEVKAALDSFGQSGEDNPLVLLIGQKQYGEGLTNAEKAAIWQSYNKTWKPSQNPYDKAVGQKVYNWMQAQENEEEPVTTTGNIGDEIMRQIIEKYK